MQQGRRWKTIHGRKYPDIYLLYIVLRICKNRNWQCKVKKLVLACMYAYIQACILIGKRGEEEKNCLAHWGMYACNRPDIFLLRTKSRLAELTSSAILSSSLTMCVCRRSSTTSRMSSYPACQPTSLSHYLSLSFSLSFSFSPTQLYNCTTTIRTYILLFTSARHHCLKLIEKGKKGRRRKKNWPVFLSFPFSLSLSLSLSFMLFGSRRFY